MDSRKLSHDELEAALRTPQQRDERPVSYDFQTWAMGQGLTIEHTEYWAALQGWEAAVRAHAPAQHDERPVLTDEQIEEAAIWDSHGIETPHEKDSAIDSFMAGAQWARKMLGAEGGEK